MAAAAVAAAIVDVVVVRRRRRGVDVDVHTRVQNCVYNLFESDRASARALLRVFVSRRCVFVVVFVCVCRYVVLRTNPDTNGRLLSVCLVTSPLERNAAASTAAVAATAAVASASYSTRHQPLQRQRRVAEWWWWWWSLSSSSLSACLSGRTCATAGVHTNA